MIKLDTIDTLRNAYMLREEIKSTLDSIQFEIYEAEKNGENPSETLIPMSFCLLDRTKQIKMSLNELESIVSLRLQWIENKIQSLNQQAVEEANSTCDID